MSEGTRSESTRAAAGRPPPGTEPPRPVREPSRPVRGPSPASAIGVYVIVLIVLQIFLLTVAIDAFHEDDAGLAWAAGITSVVLTASAAVLHRVFGER